MCRAYTIWWFKNSDINTWVIFKFQFLGNYTLWHNQNGYFSPLSQQRMPLMWFSYVCVFGRANGRKRKRERECDKCLDDISWLYIRRHYCNPGQRITCHIMAWNKFIQLRKFISGHVSKLVPTIHFWHRIISFTARPLLLWPMLMLFAAA